MQERELYIALAGCALCCHLDMTNNKTLICHLQQGLHYGAAMASAAPTAAPRTPPAFDAAPAQNGSAAESSAVSGQDPLQRTPSVSSSVLPL